VLTHVPPHPVTSSVYLVTQMSPAHWPDRTTNEVLGCEDVRGGVVERTKSCVRHT
jgi:hypothetical protein